MRHAHRYPLSADVLPAYCHPAENHPLHHPARLGREILAGNGYIALRIHRGGWIDSEFSEAGPAFLARFEKLPWHRFSAAVDGPWRALDEQRGKIFDKAPIGLWLAGKCAPSPVWSVNEIPVRLSHIQAIAMLPRCEISVARAWETDPLWFRFSGGHGCIARDPRLTITSGNLFAPARDPLTDERMEHRRAAIRWPQPGVNWPPPEPTDT